ncbi:unnamed protein product [Rhizopus microsporus]
MALHLTFKIYGFSVLLSRDLLLRVKLSHLPFLPEHLLTQGIFDLLAPYGIVLEGGIFLNNGWFDGTSYAILQFSADHDLPELTHALSWNDENVMYAAWPSIPLHCNYCHKPNHSRSDCPVRSALRCWTYLSNGHIRAHCPQLVIRTTASVKSKPAKKPNKSTKHCASTVPSVPKHSPPSSNSETDSVSPTRLSPLKQPRPNTATFMEVEKPPSISRSTPAPPSHDSSLDQTLKTTVPTVFAKALRGG